LPEGRSRLLHRALNPRFAHGLLRLVASAAFVALAGCASESTVRQYVPQIVTPYRIDIQQGNFITQDMLDKLSVGQTRDQVRFIMGTPLVADMFHANRWDYVFRASKGWRDPEARRLVIHFDADGRVARWETEGAPAPRESANVVPVAADKPAPAGDKPAAGAEPAPPKAAPDGPPGQGSAPPAGSGAVSGAAAPAAMAVAAAPSPPSTPLAEQPSIPTAAAPSTPSSAPPSSPAAAAVVPATVPAAGAAAAPKPVPSTRADGGTALPSTVLAALESWRAAWSARDVERYLSMYATDFRLPAGLSRARWEAQRRERIRRPSFIVVKVVDPQVSIAGESVATAVFTQVYESDSVKESGRKTLALVRQGGDWKIRDERFEK
jgi:outer membrane protein assembly factor BamE